MEQQKDGKVTVYTFGNAVICVTRPTLTDAEREKQERKILTSLHQYGKSMVEKSESRNAS